MNVMDLLYETEETSMIYSSPHSLAASVLVCTNTALICSRQVLCPFGCCLDECLTFAQVASYVLTVPKQQWEFPLLPWGEIL